MIRAGSSPAAEPVPFRTMERSLRFVLLGTFTLRFSTGLTGAMLGLYLAKLPAYGGPAVDARLVGVFAAIFYLSELVLSPIFGILSDRTGHHRVMLYGPIFGAVAVVITGLTAYWLNTGFQVDAQLPILGFTRLLEGASTAASVPSILGFIALATAGNELLRGKAAARFEGATLAGLGFGFIVAPTLFAAIGRERLLPQRGRVRHLIPHLLARGQGPGRRGRSRRLAACRDSAATSRSSARRMCSCSHRRGSRSTRASACGSASRSSSSRRPTRPSPTRS